jgi:hypothetical protein
MTTNEIQVNDSGEHRCGDQSEKKRKEIRGRDGMGRDKVRDNHKISKMVRLGDEYTTEARRARSFSIVGRVG